MARSVFYYHLKRLRAADKYVNEKDNIKAIFHEHKGRYGYRRITAEMRNRGFIINHKTVQTKAKSVESLPISLTVILLHRHPIRNGRPM